MQRYAKKYPRDLLLGYEKAQKSGYVRSYGCFKRTASKLRPPEKKKRARQNKPYERAAYPGQKLQVDVKFVPSYCVANGQKYYQFTAKLLCDKAFWLKDGKLIQLRDMSEYTAYRDIRR